MAKKKQHYIVGSKIDEEGNTIYYMSNGTTLNAGKKIH